jgi:hypothetical protein
VIFVATKLLTRPSETFVDSLITSIWALYITIISFVALYAYVGINVYEHSQIQPKLVALDKLLALRPLTVFSNFQAIRPAKMKDIPHFFQLAMSESFDQVVAEDEAADNPDKSKPPPPSKFDATLLANSQIYIDVPMRMSVNGACDVLITQLASGETFNFVSFLVVGEIHAVKSENAKLANFHGCEPGLGQDLQVLILELEDGQHAFAIPRSVEEEFLGKPSQRFFSNYPFEKPDRVIDLMPEQIRPYVEKFRDEFVFVHARAIDYLILKFANDELGKRLTHDRLENAVQLLYEQKERDASYFGIGASSTLLIRLGPLVFFALSFELWRRVRRLPDGKLTSDKYWFAFETRDIIGRTYGFLYATAPLIFGVLIYSLFAISQSLGLVVFGREVTLIGILTLNFPFTLGAGWQSYDPFAFAMLTLVPIHFFILLLTVRKLIAVVACNVRPVKISK